MEGVMYTVGKIPIRGCFAFIRVFDFVVMDAKAGIWL